mmetsp:Transcript_2304/g.8884  ORF Transcript_2304/g.8884 Transcript_2304/m.8884 type:complete len:265 (-) Transcript_2304:476-1270(-)
MSLETAGVGEVLKPANITHVVDFRMSRRKSFLRHKKHSTWKDVSDYEARHGILISGFGDNHHHRLRDSRKLGMLMWIVLMAASVGNHLSVQRAATSDAMRSHLVPTLMELSGYLQSSELRTLSFQNREIMHLVPWHVSLRDISCTLSSGHLFKPVNLPAPLSGVIVGLFSGKPPNERCAGMGIIMSYSESQGALHIITPLSIFALQMVDNIVLSGMLAPCHQNRASIYNLSSDQCFYGLTTQGTGARSIRSRNNIARGGRTTRD